jgi:hypothetical protein
MQKALKYSAKVHLLRAVGLDISQGTKTCIANSDRPNFADFLEMKRWQLRTKDHFGMFYASSGTFPNLYVSKFKGWAFLSDDNGVSSYLYDCMKNQWLLFPRN